MSLREQKERKVEDLREWDTSSGEGRGQEKGKLRSMSLLFPSVGMIKNSCTPVLSS